ncbi:MAG: homoserine dehydrogenase [Magnetococcales bacterium]|nr:homoserine dehydrogenase [Magnetococcales bacterium]
MEELRIGVLGFGTVGTGTVRLLLTNGELLAQRTGVRFRLVRIATLDPQGDRGLDLAGIEVTDDAWKVVDGDDIDVVVEVMGGLEPAGSLVLRALRNGKPVVTANKALLAQRGEGLIAEALRSGVELGFEAAVAGAVPVIKALKESLAANRIQQVYGILNGTCNYILTEMREKGLPFATVLGEAQRLGFAEADPSFDVDGIDAAHKLTILASLAFGTPLDFERVTVEGIRHVSDVDIAWATEMGYRIKLLAMARRSGDEIELGVRPVLVADASMVATVEGVFNAVFIEGDFSGTTMYYGRGAGERPTASAVVADLVEIGRNRRSGARGRVPTLSILPQHLVPLPVRDSREQSGEYYIRLEVRDRPGVLAQLTEVLARFGISIDAIHQKGRSQESAVPLVMVTHETTERQVRDALVQIAALDPVSEPPRLIRIESGLA